MSSPSYWSTLGTHLQSPWWFVMAVAGPQIFWPLDTNTLRREGMYLNVHNIFFPQTRMFFSVLTVEILHLSCSSFSDF